ncbi:hypothetical protein Taro_016503 [Colocasia esculenta]|uniref:Uncharacterized protein n=1 Tax=Colocasia esculenta TaxID=4460 RepID=A0A843UKW1_COLES|nr:hypothetical protein [Colocasia esculenta]
MGSPENPNWLLECPLVDEIPVTVGDLAAPAGGFYWAPQGFDGPTDASWGIQQEVLQMIISIFTQVAVMRDDHPKCNTVNYQVSSHNVTAAHSKCT